MTLSCLMGGPVLPSPAHEPAFDPASNAWALSRYSDVLAALHEPALWPVPPRKTKNLKIPDKAALADLRVSVLNAFSPARLNEWQGRIDRAARALPSDGQLDLVADFAEPLCLAAAEIVTGSKAPDRHFLLAAARTVSNAAAEPLDEDLRLLATKADAALNRYFESSAIPMAGPTFVALSRTLSCLLLNGWVALLGHRLELTRLQASPDQLPKAIEEILRYACVPQSVFRYVSQPLELCGLQLKEGDRLVLQIASANRDPAHFADPHRFDSTRRGPSHLSLGFGLHSCVGGALIRMVAASATRAFVTGFADYEIEGPVEWSGGSGFRSPSRLNIRHM